LFYKFDLNRYYIVEKNIGGSKKWHEEEENILRMT